MKPKGKIAVIDILSEFEGVLNDAKNESYVVIYTQAHEFHGFVTSLDSDSIKLRLCGKDGSMQKGYAKIGRPEIIAINFCDRK